MEAPQYQPLPPDPGFLMLQQQSQQQDIAAIQDRVRGDQANLLARYGANLAMAGTAASPAPGIAPTQLMQKAG
jgi:hypothetical protein